MPGYSALLSLTAIFATVSKKLLPVAAARIVLVPLAVAALLVFSDNVLRAAAALMALDEQVRVARFQSFRVFWRLLKMLPVLAATQFKSVFFIGPGWVIGDCLWPVICVVEKLTGREAIQRSRNLMTGLRSAGRALAIRHFALAVFAISDLVKSIGFLWQNKPIKDANVVISTVWFPVFALFAAAPLFLYDRTAANESGPLLQLDRTPEVRITARPLSARLHDLARRRADLLGVSADWELARSVDAKDSAEHCYDRRSASKTMALRFYNTLTQEVQPFTPLHDNEVRMYTCGPTVYNFVHIGNLRTFSFQDVLRRWLRARGYKLNHVMNITDVEDKIIRNAAAEGKTLNQYTEPYTQAFLEDCAKLRLQRPERIVKATEQIDAHGAGYPKARRPRASPIPAKAPFTTASRISPVMANCRTTISAA